MRIKLFEEWCVDVYESKKDFLPFEKAREFVQSLGLNTLREWHVWASSKERPENIPTNPDKTYGNKGWISYGDWLGTERVRYTNFLPFEEAREFAQSLGLNTQKEWHAWAASKERPENIPANPDKTYGDKGWISYGDWLGTGRVYKKDFLPFEEAREFVQSFGLNSKAEWKVWVSSKERPENIPTNPDITYKNKGWISWGDWLGTGRVYKKDFLPFEEAREFARSLGLNTLREWHVWASSKERPENIPASPHKIYKDKGWIGYTDWLGTDNKEKIDYVSYDLAKEMIQPFEIKSPVEWTQYYIMDLIPKTIPKNPSVFYADKGWMGWEDFLGSRKKFG
jgi:hypothetical protein